MQLKVKLNILVICDIFLAGDGRLGASRSNLFDSKHCENLPFDFPARFSHGDVSPAETSAHHTESPRLQRTTQFSSGGTGALRHSIATTLSLFLA